MASPKLAAHALLEPVLATPSLRLVCHEGEVDQLLAELSLHQLDLVLAGQPAPHNPNLRLTSERLVESPVEWYGPAAHVHKADIDGFPQSLGRLPVLLPTGHSALRRTLDRWFESQGLRPHIVGEFEDSALLTVFAARGLGVFPISRLGADDVGQLRGLRLLGRCDDVKEEIHAIRSRPRPAPPAGAAGNRRGARLSAAIRRLLRRRFSGFVRHRLVVEAPVGAAQRRAPWPLRRRR